MRKALEEWYPNLPFGPVRDSHRQTPIPEDDPLQQNLPPGSGPLKTEEGSNSIEGGNTLTRFASEVDGVADPRPSKKTRTEL